MADLRTREGNVYGEEVVISEVLNGVWHAAISQQARHLPVQCGHAHIARACQPGAFCGFQEAPGHAQVRIWLVHHHQQVCLRACILMTSAMSEGLSVYPQL